MASSSSTVEEPPTSPVVANAPPLVTTTEAKMIVATSRDHCQQLKEMLSKEETSSMEVVVASSNQTSTPSPPSPPPVMDPRLLAVACSGSWKKMQSFLNGADPDRTSIGIEVTVRCCCCSSKDRLSVPPAEAREGTIRCCCFLWKRRQSSPAKARPTPTTGPSEARISSNFLDEEAQMQEAFWNGLTVEGDTFLHVMATNSISEDLVEDGLICRKALEYLSKKNKNGDTPLHCAARADKYQMVSLLIDLAKGQDNNANRAKALLETENSNRRTVLHEAVHVGNIDMVNLLMREDPELASFPKDGTSPLYLAILQENKTIAETLYEMSGGIISYSGPDGQNALHAAVHRGELKILERWW